MHHPGLAAILLTFAALIIVMAWLMVLISSRARESSFAGPRLDAWLKARRQLHRADQWRVTWATRRNRPVSRGDLAEAQLAYVRYLQDAARRAHGAPGWRRAVSLAWFLGMASLNAWIAVTSTRTSERIAQIVLAAVIATSGLLVFLTARRATVRLGERMARLETAIGDRHDLNPIPPRPPIPPAQPGQHEAGSA